MSYSSVIDNRTLYSLKWALSNKEVIEEIYTTPVKAIDFFNENTNTWDFLPDREERYNKYKSKVEIAKTKSGCTSCKINAIRHEVIADLKGIIINARASIKNYNPST